MYAQLIWLIIIINVIIRTIYVSIPTFIILLWCWWTITISFSHYELFSAHAQYKLILIFWIVVARIKNAYLYRIHIARRPNRGYRIKGDSIKVVSRAVFFYNKSPEGSKLWLMPSALEIFLFLNYRTKS